MNDFNQGTQPDSPNLSQMDETAMRALFGQVADMIVDRSHLSAQVERLTQDFHDHQQKAQQDALNMRDSWSREVSELREKWGNESRDLRSQIDNLRQSLVTAQAERDQAIKERDEANGRARSLNELAASRQQTIEGLKRDVDEATQHWMEEQDKREAAEKKIEEIKHLISEQEAEITRLRDLAQSRLANSERLQAALQEERSHHNDTAGALAQERSKLAKVSEILGHLVPQESKQAEHPEPVQHPGPSVINY